MQNQSLENKTILDDDPSWLKIKELQEKLSYDFREKELLELALTHSSRANELQKPECQNERLEFLGDAVLELCVSSELFRRFPEAREGDLTRIRASLVNARALASIARKIKLPSLLKLGKGEERQGGKEKDSILSDAMEAILGAIYQDGGFMAVSQTVLQLYKDLWPASWRDQNKLDNKSRLQSICQRQFRAFPLYTLLSSIGPAHAPLFEIKLELPDGSCFTSTDISCKKAEQKVAGLALAALKEERG